MCSIGCRLKEERERLNLNQTNFAEIGGVKRRAQVNYESGDSAPDANYLSKVAAIGVDIQYVITGIRSGEAEPLKPDEAALLDNYRHSPEEGKRAIEAASSILAQRKEAKGKVA